MGPISGAVDFVENQQGPPEPAIHNLAWDTFLLLLLFLSPSLPLLPATRETITETCRPVLGSLNE